MTEELKSKLLSAAKAAGYEVGEGPCGDILMQNASKQIVYWQPHLVFSDAARLAFDCGMSISYKGGEISIPQSDADFCEDFYFTPGDQQSFCASVVEAAAELWRMMK